MTLNIHVNDNNISSYICTYLQQTVSNRECWEDEYCIASEFYSANGAEKVGYSTRDQGEYQRGVWCFIIRFNSMYSIIVHWYVYSGKESVIK